MHQSYRIRLFMSYFIVKYINFAWNVTQTMIYRHKINRYVRFFLLICCDSCIFHETMGLPSTEILNFLTALDNYGVGFWFIVSCTQDLSSNTSEYTANLLGRAQPKLQLEIPMRYHLLFLGQTRGPPPSPWHEPTPPLEKPTQRMRSVTFNPRSLYARRQVSRGTRGTWACCKI